MLDLTSPSITMLALLILALIALADER